MEEPVVQQKDDSVAGVPKDDSVADALKEDSVSNFSKEDSVEDVPKEELSIKKEEEESNSGLTQVDCSTLPDFPEILSFLEKFTTLLNLNDPVSFTDLKIGAESHAPFKTGVWKDLHCSLMRRINKTFKAEKWTTELLRFVSKYDVVTEDIEGGYTGLPVEMKLDILKLLCDLQFTYNAKFKERIESMEDPATLRIDPFGRDKHGNSYYYFQDHECNLYLYRSPESSLQNFEVVATDRNGVALALEQLKSEIQGILANTTIEVAENGVHEPTVDNRPQSSNTNGENGDKGSNRSESKCSQSSSLQDSPEKVRGTSSPILSTSPTARRRPSVPSPSQDSSGSNSSISSEKPKNKTPSRKNKKTKTKSQIQNSKKNRTPKRKPKAKNLDDEDDNDESGSECGKLARDQDHEDDSVEDEAPLSSIRTSLRTPRAAAARASAKLSSSPSKPRGSQKKQKVSEDEKEESEHEGSDEESEMTESEEDEYMPAKAKKGRGRGRGRVLKNLTPVTMKATTPGRGRKKNIPEPEPIDSSDIEDDTECGKCHKFNHPSKLLLCDKCDAGAYHTFCLVPPVTLIPEGDWFCPICEHRVLVEKLEGVLQKLDLAIKDLERKRAREARGRKELQKLMDDPNYGRRSKHEEANEGDSSSGLEDGADFGMRKCRRKRKVDYSLTDYDRKVNDAILGKYEDDEQLVRPRKGRSRNLLVDDDEDMADEHRSSSKKLEDGDEEDREDQKPEDYALPEWMKEENEEVSPTPRGRSRASKRESSDEEYQPSDDEYKPKKAKNKSTPTASRGRGRPRGRPREYSEDSDEVYEPVSEKKERKKLPKNWEEEEYHMSWDEGSVSENWDSDEMSDFGGKKRKRPSGHSRNRQHVKKKPRFLYASSDSDSDNADYDDYKVKSKTRHRGRRQFPTSDEESASASESESEWEDNARRKSRRKTNVQKVRKAIAKKKEPSQAKSKPKGSSFGEEEMVHRSTRIATRERIDYGKYMDDDEEEDPEVVAKRQKEAQLGKIALPFEADLGTDEDSTPETKSAVKSKRKVMDSENEDKSETEDEGDTEDEEEVEKEDEKEKEKGIGKKEENGGKKSSESEEDDDDDFSEEDDERSKERPSANSPPKAKTDTLISMQRPLPAVQKEVKKPLPSAPPPSRSVVASISAPMSKPRSSVTDSTTSDTESESVVKTSVSRDATTSKTPVAPTVPPPISKPVSSSIPEKPRPQVSVSAPIPMRPMLPVGATVSDGSLPPNMVPKVQSAPTSQPGPYGPMPHQISSGGFPQNRPSLVQHHQAMFNNQSPFPAQPFSAQPNNMFGSRIPPGGPPMYGPGSAFPTQGMVPQQNTHRMPGIMPNQQAPFYPQIWPGPPRLAPNMGFAPSYEHHQPGFMPSRPHMPPEGMNLGQPRPPQFPPGMPPNASMGQPAPPSAVPVSLPNQQPVNPSANRQATGFEDLEGWDDLGPSAPRAEPVQ